MKKYACDWPAPYAPTENPTGDFYLCSEADEVLANARTAAMVEIRAKDEVIAKLKELVRYAFYDGMGNGIADQRGNPSVDWQDSESCNQLGSILHPSVRGDGEMSGVTQLQKIREKFVASYGTEVTYPKLP